MCLSVCLCVLVCLSGICLFVSTFVCLYMKFDRDVHINFEFSDLVNIKVLNAGAWSRSSERVPVTLPRELEDFIPEVEQFYRDRHQGRKLHWHHILSNGVVR